MLEKEIYKESIFLSHYKGIRNLYKEFNPDSIFNACISFLYQPVKNKIDQIYKQPWDIFLLLKWVYSDLEFSKTKSNIDHISFDKLRKLMYDTHKKVMPLNQYSHMDIYFRNKAFQQFLYQENIELNSILRQKILIESIQDNHPIHKTFKKLTGLNIQTFSDLSIILLGYFIYNKKNTVSDNDFSKLNVFHSQKQIQYFWSCISISFDQLRDKFVKYSNPRSRISFEYYEHTPFLQFPLVRFPSGFLCVNHYILFRCLETFVYDFLRANDANKFMPKFGHVFENYVEKTLKYSEIKFINEKEIKSILGNDCRVVDFIIKDNNSNIFIEAKSVEMSYKGKFSPDPKKILRSTRKPIIDAIDQAHQINYRIHEINSNDIIPQNNNYLVVVTFKEMYLSNGKTYYDIVDQKYIDKIYSSYDFKIRIPLENMYFITISEFDRLVEHVKQNKTTFSDAIEFAKRKDVDQSTVKFDFSQHLSEMEAYDVPSFLEDELIQIKDNISKSVKQKNRRNNV